MKNRKWKLRRNEEVLSQTEHCFIAVIIEAWLLVCPTFSFHILYELTTILGVLRGLVHFSPTFQLCWSR